MFCICNLWYRRDFSQRMFFNHVLPDCIAQQLVKLLPLSIVSLRRTAPDRLAESSTYKKIYICHPYQSFIKSDTYSYNIRNRCRSRSRSKSRDFKSKSESISNLFSKKKVGQGLLKSLYCFNLQILHSFNNFQLYFNKCTMAANPNLENGNGIPHDTGDSIDRFYFLIDIGANLTNKKFSRDVDSVVQRAKEAGVLKIMVTGSNISVSKEALRLTRLFPDTLFATAGIHPHDAKTFDESSISEIESLCSNPEVVALGECGLDFNRNFSPPEVQLEVFEKQVELACRLKKPLFLHERDAHEEMLKVLKKYEDQLPPSVLHCFTGTVDQAKAYVDLGLYIGLTGYVWKDKSEDGVRKMLTDNVVPLDRLLVETDSPFMYPNTRSAKLSAEMKQVMTPRSLNYLNRHCTFQRNEPCSLPATLEMISALMNKQPEEIAMATTYNAVKLFGLSS